jgi:Helix-turn-helix domain
MISTRKYQSFLSFWPKLWVIRVGPKAIARVEALMDAVIAPATDFIEPYVDAQNAATFLAMSRKNLLDLARKGKLPGHPVGSGPRKTWKFRLSELEDWMQTEVISTSHRGRAERSFS